MGTPPILPPILIFFNGKFKHFTVLSTIIELFKEKKVEFYDRLQNSKTSEFSNKNFLVEKKKKKIGGQHGCSHPLGQVTRLKLNDGRDKAVMCLSQEAQACYHYTTEA